MPPPPLPVKILVVGEVTGAIKALADKVERITRLHGPFALVLAVGRFFAASELKNSPFMSTFTPLPLDTPFSSSSGSSFSPPTPPSASREGSTKGDEEERQEELEVFLRGEARFPVPLYFICGREHPSRSAMLSPFPEGCSLCSNIHYLGRSGQRKLCGLSVVYLSGVYNESAYYKAFTPDADIGQVDAQWDGYYSEADALAISRSVAGDRVDLLLTSEWGKHWSTFVPSARLPSSSLLSSCHNGSPVVAKLASQLNVRYHFAAGEDVYFELPPYRTRAPDSYTRFFALGSFVSSRKQKSLYACNVALSKDIDCNPLPDDVTNCPYVAQSSKVRDKPHLLEQEQPRKRLAGFVPAGHINQEDEQRQKNKAQFSEQVHMSTKNIIAEPPPGYRCRLCNIEGHFVRDCPEKTTSDGPGQIHERIFSELPPDTYTCILCRVKGHWKRSCPQAKSSASGHQGVGQENQNFISSNDLSITASQPQSHQQRAPYLCRVCKISGHFLRDCPQLLASYICNKCKQKGHFIRQCPLIAAENDSGAVLNASNLQSRPLPNDYVCRKCSGSHWIRQCPLVIAEEAEKMLKRTEKANEEVVSGVDSEGCWLCLSTTDAPHLVIAVGESIYLASPKGPLTEESLLILPVDHVQSQAQMTSAQTAEVDRFKQAVHEYYASISKHPIFFERNIPTKAGQHCHLYAVSLSEDETKRAQGALEHAAKSVGANLEKLEEPSTLQSCIGDNHYLYFELHDGQRFIHRVTKGKIPGLFHFSRNTIAELLGKSERANWKHIQMTVEEETLLSEHLKQQSSEFFEFTIRL